MSGGKSSSNSSTQQAVWDPQAKVLEQMYEEAPQLLKDMQSQIPGLQQGMQQWNQGIQDTSNTAWQNQMGGGNLGGYDIAGSLRNSLHGAMSNPSNAQAAASGMQGFNQGSGFQGGDGFQREGGGNYSDAYRQTFMDDARGAADMNLQAMDARAAASGMSGGSRHGTAIAQGASDINSNLQSNLANIGYQDYNNRQNMGFQDYTNQQNIGFQDYTNAQNLGSQNYNMQADRTMAAAQGADQQRLQQQSMMQSLLGQQNANEQYGLSQSGNMMGLGQSEYQTAMLPTQTYGQLMQAMGAPTVLSESDSSSKSRQGGL